MLEGSRRLLSVLRENPDFLPRLFARSSVRQLVRGMRVSREYGDSIAAVVPGQNTTLVVDDGRIVANGHVVVGTSGPSYLKPADTVLCVENGRFESTSENILYVGKGTTLSVNGGDLRIGDVQAMYGCEIHCTEEISIGDGCGIGPGVVIRDGHPHTFAADGRRRTTSAPIVLEDDVIMPGQALVKKGVRIGEGAVVASGSVVTGDVPARSLVAGVPAEVVATDVNWEF